MERIFEELVRENYRFGRMCYVSKCTLPTNNIYRKGTSVWQNINLKHYNFM